MKKYTKQVNVEHYDSETYLNKDRWISYRNQLVSVEYISKLLKTSSLHLLEIGVGDMTVSTLLKKKKHKVQTQDIDRNLYPDYLLALPQVPQVQKKFDCILCCEVLEHIRYEDVEKSLKNMALKSKYAVLSVPHKSLYFSATLRFPILKPIEISFSLPTQFIMHKFNGEHYWELGTKGNDVNKFLKSIALSGYECLTNFRVHEYPYHHFFILKSLK